MTTKKKVTKKVKTTQKDTTFIALCIKGDYTGVIGSGNTPEEAYEMYEFEEGSDTASYDKVIIIKVNYPKQTAVKATVLKVNKEITI